MIDIKSDKLKNKVILMTSNGNPNEVIGSNAKEPTWKNIIEMNGNSKYKGSTQYITSALDNYEISIPTLETTKNDNNKFTESITYTIKKELLQAIIHNELPFEASINLPFDLLNIDVSDVSISNDGSESASESASENDNSKDSNLKDNEDNDMTGLLMSCYDSNNYDDILESDVKFYRKTYVRYISSTESEKCIQFTGIHKFNINNFKHVPKNEMISAIKVYYIPNFIKTIKCFSNKLEKYGSWTIDNIFPTDNEYCIVNYKQLTPSNNYIELRKDSDVYKNFIKSYDNSKDANIAFKYRQETAIDLLKGLGASLENVKDLHVYAGSEQVDLKYEASIASNYNSNRKVRSAYASQMIPIVKNAISTSKNNYNHIWNYYDFLLDDIKITANYVPEVVLNGNLFSDVNIPSNIKSSDVLLNANSIKNQNESFEAITKSSTENQTKTEAFDLFKGISNLASKISNGVSTMVKQMADNYKENLAKSREFIRNDEYIKDLNEYYNKTYTVKTLKQAIDELKVKYKDYYYVDYLNRQFNIYLNDLLNNNELNNKLLNERYSKMLQFVNGKAYCFRYIIIQYYINFFRTQVNKPLKVASRNYVDGKFYNPSEHPLLTQYVEVPSIKWISEDAKDYCKKAIIEKIIPNIYNRLIDISKNEKIKKLYLLNKYQTLIKSNSLFSKELIEFPFISILGVFDNDVYTSLNNVNYINKVETDLKNSLFDFNSRLYSKWIQWNYYKHLQINIPKWNESIQLFKLNLQMINVSFPTISEDINMNAIEVFADGFDEGSVKKAIENDNNFISLDDIKVPLFDTNIGDYKDANIKIYIPKSLKNNIKLIEGKTNKFMIINYHNDGNMNIPNPFLNFINL